MISSYIIADPALWLFKTERGIGNDIQDYDNYMMTFMKSSRT